MNKYIDYSVILPTFNEAGHIERLIKDISNIFFNLSIKHEIIVVDDQSTDGTIEIVQKLRNSYKNINIHVRENKKNSLVESLQLGIDISKYKKIIWLDADFSHPPNYINDFIKINNSNNFDVIVCSRFLKDSLRYYDKDKVKPKNIDRLSHTLNKICQILINKDFKDYTSGYICIDKDSLKNKKLKGYYGDYFILLITYLISENKKICEIPYIEEDRASGISKTTGDKIDFFIKCFFYLFCILKSFFIYNYRSILTKLKK